MYARMLDAVGIAVEDLAVLAAHIFFPASFETEGTFQNLQHSYGEAPSVLGFHRIDEALWLEDMLCFRGSQYLTPLQYLQLQSRHRDKPHARMRSAAVATNCLLIVEPRWTWPIAFW